MHSLGECSPLQNKQERACAFWLDLPLLVAQGATDVVHLAPLDCVDLAGLC